MKCRKKYLFAEKFPMPRDLSGSTQRSRIEHREDSKREVSGQDTSEVLALARNVVIEPIKDEHELVLATVPEEKLEEASTL